ncbi:MAG: patatin-like phospholipase family protein [Gammaproteobacteria bacterium]|nr:patatin-like phospholipase family protein [Gammaproteobacteria bacterium]
MKIGLALGSGSSRGWSHIGIIKELSMLGIEPDIVCGTSVGAMVGAAYVTGNIERLQSWACSVTKFDVARFLDISTSFTGFVNTERFNKFLCEYIASDKDLIEDLPKVYAAISTDLDTGKEVWLQQGSVIQAVWSSMALPGLFPAIRHNNRWLVDGGLVNPVPVSVCRALGADIVIAVNLNGDIVGKRLNKTVAKNANTVSGKLSELVKEYTSLSSFESADTEQPPSLLDAIAASVNITQDRVTRSRLAGEPPDIVFSPKLSGIGLLELYRAEEAIEEGRQCVQRIAHEIEYVLGIKRSEPFN